MRLADMVHTFSCGSVAAERHVLQLRGCSDKEEPFSPVLKSSTKTANSFRVRSFVIVSGLIFRSSTSQVRNSFRLRQLRAPPARQGVLNPSWANYKHQQLGRMDIRTVTILGLGYDPIFAPLRRHSSRALLLPLHQPSFLNTNKKLTFSRLAFFSLFLSFLLRLSYSRQHEFISPSSP